MYLCFGTLARLIKLSSAQKTTDKMVYNALMSIVDQQYTSDFQENSGQISKIMTCKINLNAGWVIDAVKKMSIKQIRNGVNMYVIGLIDREKAGCLVMALLDAVLTSVQNPDTIIGSISRSDLSKKQEFNVTEFLADIFYYVIVFTKNEDKSGSVSRLTEEFLNGFVEAASKIVVRFDTRSAITELGPALKDTNFDEVFERFECTGISTLKNRGTINLYHLNIMSAAFEYTALCEYLYDCVGNYVFSRVQIDNLDKAHRIKHLTANALKKMRSAYRNPNTGNNELGQMLVFAFLEEVLHAHKLLSRVEIDSTGLQSEMCCEAIHLLKHTIEGKDCYQLVFGTSCIDDDITVAIDSAFEVIKRIDSKAFFHKTSLRSALTSQSFDENTLEWLRSIIIPGQGNNMIDSTGIGVFIGYSLNVDEDDNALFTTKAYTQMLFDLKRAAAYISEKITEYNIGKYSYYFYFLPLNNAGRDKVSIIEHIIIE